MMNEKIKATVKGQIIANLNAKKNALVELGVEINETIEQNLFKKTIKFSFLKGLIKTVKDDCFTNQCYSLIIKRDILLKEAATINAEIKSLKANIYGQVTISTLKSNTNFNRAERSAYYTADEYTEVKNHLVEKLTSDEIDNNKYLCDLSTFFDVANFKSDNSKFLADKVTLNFASLKANIQKGSLLHDMVKSMLNMDTDNLIKLGKNSFKFSTDNKVYLA